MMFLRLESLLQRRVADMLHATCSAVHRPSLFQFMHDGDTLWKGMVVVSWWRVLWCGVIPLDAVAMISAIGARGR